MSARNTKVSPAKFIQVLNIKILVYSEEMVITAQVLLTSRVASLVFVISLSPRHMTTTVAPNHYKVTNAMQCTDIMQQTNKPTNATIKQATQFREDVKILLCGFCP